MTKKKKLHKHNVTLTDKRRDQKKTTDILRKSGSKQNLQVIFNTIPSALSGQLKIEEVLLDQLIQEFPHLLISAVNLQIPLDGG